LSQAYGWEDDVVVACYPYVYYKYGTNVEKIHSMETYDAYVLFITIIMLGLIIFGLVLMYKMNDLRTNKQKKRSQLIGVIIVILATAMMLSAWFWWIWKFNRHGRVIEVLPSSGIVTPTVAPTVAPVATRRIL
jgi:O-antigen/teichoic acid export membrane protein